MALSRQPTQSTDVCTPETQLPWEGSTGWSGGASGSLGTQGIFGPLWRGAQDVSGYTAGLTGPSLWGATPWGGAGLGAGLAYYGGTDAAYGQNSTADGGTSTWGDLTRTKYGVDGLYGGFELGPLSQSFGGDVFANRSHADGQITRDASGGFSSFNLNGSRTAFGGENLWANHSVAGLSSSQLSIGQANGLQTGFNSSLSRDASGRWNAAGDLYTGSNMSGINFANQNPLGDSNVSLGQIGMGNRVFGGGFYDPATGTGEINGGFSQRSLMMRDLSYDGSYFGDNLSTHADMGALDYGMDASGAMGWDGSHAYMRGQGNVGIGATDLNAGWDLGGGLIGGDGHIGGVRYGYQGDGQINIGADGLNASGNARGGGVQIDDFQSGYHLGDWYNTQLSVGHASNDVVVNNGHLTVNGSGLNAGVDQVRAGGMRGQNIGLDTNLGPLSTHVGAGEVSNDVIVNNGSLTLNGDGLDASVGDARFGGIRGTNVNAGWDLWGQNASFNAGDISNDHQIRGANVHVDQNGMNASLEHYRGGGIRGTNLSAQQHLLGTDSHLNVGEVSVGDTTLDGAYFNRDLTGLKGDAGFRALEFGGFRVNDVQGGFENQTLGVNGNYGGSFATSDAIKGARANWDLTDITNPQVAAHMDEFGMPGWNLTNAHVGLNGPWGTSANASLEDLHQGFAMQNVDASFNVNDGLRASVGHAQWDTLAGKNLDVNADLGPLYNASLHAGEGWFNRFSGDNIRAGLDLTNGLTASGDNLQYGYLGFNDVHTRAEMFDGALSQQLDADVARGLGVDVGHLDFQTNGLNQSLAAQNLHAYGLDVQGLNYEMGVGDANFGLGADRLSALDLTVGDLRSNTSYMGLQGNSSMSNANLDVLNVQNGHVGLGYGDQELLGASGSLRGGVSVEQANADWNLFGGTANANFQNARMGSQLSDASINLFGNEIALPDAGYALNASGGANMDLSQGAANANLSLAGSSVNFAGTELTLGDWAQASGGVNLSEGSANANIGGENGLTAGVNLFQGAANMNIGGENGVGADMNLSEGNLDLNLFGNKIDVDQGLRDAWDFATSW